MSHDTLDTTRPDDTMAGGGPGPAAGASPSRRWLAALAAALALIVVAAVVAIVATNDGSDETSTPAVTTTTEAEVPAPAPGSTAPAPETTAPPSDHASALDSLEPFLTAAATMDDQLGAAAQAINGSGPPFTVVSEDVAAAVQTADLDAVAAEIPAGMPADLLQQTILVYSDLASRRSAMTDFAYAHEVPSAPTAGSSDELVRALANGHEAAQRFGDDVARLRALASDTDPFTVAAPGSRAAAAVKLHVAVVNAANGGCDSRGGMIFTTTLLPIAWQSETGGTIGDIRFEAIPAGGGWDVHLVAC